jgi:hypothetical protein
MMGWQLVGVLTAILVAFYFKGLVVALHQPMLFDDSFMFYRYALHIRQGLGVSWNLDGVHTYGETAPLWGLAVLLLSFSRLSMAHALILGSWVCSLAALAAIAWAVARNAESGTLSSFWKVLPFVVCPLLLSPIFWANAVTGMETMLAATLVGIFAGLALRWERGRVGSLWVAIAGVALCLTRPEAALVVVMLPVMFVVLGRGNWRGVATLQGIFMACMLVELLVCRWYFGTALPLSFYMKSQHGYEGYHYAWHPMLSAMHMLLNCSVFLIAIFLLAQRSDWRLLVSFTVPVVAVFGYLFAVTQIMNWDSRYYAPYVPLFAVPSLLIVARRLAVTGAPLKMGHLGRRTVLVGGVGVVLVGVAVAGHRKIVRRINEAEARLENRPYLYDPVQLGVTATKPLPGLDWYSTIHGLANIVLAPLPPGAVMASSEVGYLGAAASHANIIDLAGLNDNHIALHGFRVDELLQRKPDIIWMPHFDYTYQRGVLLSNPELLDQYDLYAGAADYGIALRKDSPVRPLIDRQWAIFWNESYHGYRMSDYLVHSTSWTGRKYRPAED